MFAQMGIGVIGVINFAQNAEPLYLKRRSNDAELATEFMKLMPFFAQNAAEKLIK